MKEIIVAGIGSCGINLAASYLSLLKNEHSFFSENNLSESENLSVHFHENESKTSHTARFIFLDQTSLSIDKLLSHPQANLLNPDNLVSDNQSSQNIYAIPYYSTHCMDQILDVFRKEMEKCDTPQGILLNNSIIGGTGSGLTSKLSNLLVEIFPDKLLIDNVIMPSFNKNGLFDVHNPISIYNANLSLPNLVENNSLTLMSDNASLNQKSIDFNIYNDGKWDTLNQFSIKAVSSLTSGSRFSGLQALNLRKFMLNTIGFPRKHFFSSNYYRDFNNNPSFVSDSKEKARNNEGCSLQIAKQDFIIDAHGGLFRGRNFSSSEIEEFNRNSLSNPCDTPNSGVIGHVYNSAENEREITVIHSGRYLGHYFQKFGEEFRKSYRRKSFVHWYTANGMDEMEMEEAESHANDLAGEYFWCTCGVDEEPEE